MRVGVDARGVLRRVRTGVVSARLGVWIRFLWLLVLLFGFTVLALTLPELWRTVRTPCTVAPCAPGQPTVAGLELLERSGLPPGLYSSLFLILGLLMSVLIPLVMGVLLWKKPRDLVVVALAFGGVTCSLMGAFSVAAARWGWLELPQHIFGVLAGAGLAFGLLAFPDGRFVPAWGRWLAYPLILASLLVFVPASWGEAAAMSAFLLAFPCAFVLLLLRYRRSEHAVQLQLKWVLCGIGMMVLAQVDSLILEALLPAPWNVPGAPGDLVTSLLGVGSVVFFWLCLAVSVYRYSLFDINLVIRRTLLYGGLSLAVTALYGGFVALAGVLSLEAGSPLVSLIAVLAVALAFHPLRSELQRGVNRLLYGQRSEPYALVSNLTERLGALLEPAQVFPVTVETVATALKLPFAEIALGPEQRRVASYGAPQGRAEHLPLRYAGEDVGCLSVSPRPGEARLSPADRRLLTDLAGQVSVSAHAYLLSADLERSRMRLVSAREEARRKLGNDLHDSVGHQLAGLMRRAETASNVLETDPARARGLLHDLVTGSRAAAAQVRALAHSLHPPELELLGLVGAVREVIEGTDTAVHVTFRAADLPRLPAAVEVSAYYTVQEALHNVYRHAHARHAWVRLELREGVALNTSPLAALETLVLELEVSDDGCGFAAGYRPGLGLRSLEGRAAELGGRCTVLAREDGGTRLLMQLPCPEL